MRFIKVTCQNTENLLRFLNYLDLLDIENHLNVVSIEINNFKSWFDNEYESTYCSLSDEDKIRWIECERACSLAG